ncbi:MAG TPA: LTA synthase family protein [Rhodoblastus sp.]|nr:LTA synthase family protein [Rhodoblastus sp.]
MRRRILLQSLVCTLGFGALFAALAVIPDNSFLGAARWFFLAAAILPALVMSWRAGVAWLALAAVLAAIVQVLNDGKIALTEMPLTWLDLQIAAANPEGFLGAMKVSPTLAFSILGATVAALLAAVGWRVTRLDRAQARANAPARAFAVALAATLGWTAVVQFAQRLETAIQGHDYAEIANTPEGLVLIEKLVGAAPFLALTARYEAHAPTPFRELAQNGALGAPAVGEATAYLKPPAAPDRLPNIAIVLLESTFDISKVFPTTPAVTSPLFPASGAGQLQGELGVHAIGGGTWISEFETITGIPSRLFGYAGYYTHVELGPYVKASLATYLKARGYQTLALYPVEGTFYGSRAAYGHYGFDRFIDGEELKIDKPWFAQDTDIMEKYLGKLAETDKAKPLFSFMLTMENHSPHPCTRFASEKEMPYRFNGATNARGTCELNEYIARYRSTEAAIASLEQALQAREKETGRPYVLAVFGDHQPNSFTGTGRMPLWSPNDYSALRRAPNDVTFYQIRSSAASPFTTKQLDISVVMLPTLVSAYVAKDKRDMYLPGNFAIQARCGEKIALPRLNKAYGRDAALPESDAGEAQKAALSQDCRSALMAARADYLRLIDIP